MNLSIKKNYTNEMITEESIFSNEQLDFINEIKLPKIVRFIRADKFDDKFINVSKDIWEFKYSGNREKISFKDMNYVEVKIIKFLLIKYIYKNSPSHLGDKFRNIRKFFKHLSVTEKIINFKKSKKILINSTDDKQFYFSIKFIIITFILEGFPEFSIDDEYDLEIIKKPKSTRSSLYYEEYEDNIDLPTINIIQKGFIELNHILNSAKKDSISKSELKNASILALAFTTGMRPVQMSKLSAGDLKEDIPEDSLGIARYSLLVPYAKQARFTHKKVAIKLPEEIAFIILTYIHRLKLSDTDKLFELGEKSAVTCSEAINDQLFKFSPVEYRTQVLSGDILQIKYSMSQFRHHVGHSMAMSGASAEEIAYILGHSSLVVARHYIFSSPETAIIRAKALGKNAAYKQMIAMFMTSTIVKKSKWLGKKVSGFVHKDFHHEIGGCAYDDTCPFEQVRNCYGCLYFHPFKDKDHSEVLESIQSEVNDIITIADSTQCSRNPLLLVHESTKFEIESVIARCSLMEDI